ncbi:MAG: helix-turn-helix domain-containing protein [Candidatus Micrarchaeota archaeon]|nr:helix-turn-helix domain-containing protein [Candidatus Micrarchaeota archaeon]
MDFECADITKVVLPAIRASTAQIMIQKYGYKQQDIARELGVAQVAVSKYLNGRYSAKVARMKDYITKEELNGEIIRRMLNNDNQEKINKAVNDLCALLLRSGKMVS